MPFVSQPYHTNNLGVKTQVEKEEVRVKLKLFETCLIPALLQWDGSLEKIAKNRNTTSRKSNVKPY